MQYALTMTDGEVKLFNSWTEAQAFVDQSPALVENVEMYDEPQMISRNLLSGKAIVLAADTPWCCNPASETYWSM